MGSRHIAGMSDAERRELWALWRLEAEAEATLHVLTLRLEDVEQQQRDVRRRLVPA